MSKLRLSLLATLLLSGFLLIGPRPHPSTQAQTNQSFDDDPQINRLLHRACANCHSTATEWPWYSSIRPVSWLLSHDVEQAKTFLDLSARGSNLTPNEKAVIYAMTARHLMPPKNYLWMHPAAKLSASDLALLARWAHSASAEAKARQSALPHPTTN